MAITENFSGLTDNADLSTLSTWDKVWSGSSQAGQISGDDRSGDMGIDWTAYAWTGSGHTALGYRRNDGTFPDDQYAQFDYLTGSGYASYNCGPAVRMNDPGGTNDGDGYYAGVTSDYAQIEDVVAGASTTIKTSFASRTYPETCKLEIVDQDLELFDDGGSVTTVTDAGGHASGNPGIVAFGSRSGDPQIDNFECSDLAATGTDAPGGLAEADAIGYNAATDIKPTGGQAAATATAYNAQGSVGANASQASVTATANNATVTTTAPTSTGMLSLMSSMM